MFLVITKDMYLLNAFKHLLRRYDVVHISSANQICEIAHKGAHVVVDSLNNNVFHSDLGSKIKQIQPTQAYVISPFTIKKCLGNTPTVFIERHASIFEFITLIERRHQRRNTRKLSLSHKQHQILTLILRESSGDDIATSLGISRKTFYSHKYNIMLLLKLRKMCDLVKLSIAPYLAETS